MTEEQARSHPGVLSGERQVGRSQNCPGGWRTKNIKATREAAMLRYSKAERSAKSAPCKAFGHTKGRSKSNNCLICGPIYNRRYYSQHAEEIKDRVRRYRLLTDNGIDNDVNSKAKRRAARAAAREAL